MKMILLYYAFQYYPYDVVASIEESLISLDCRLVSNYYLPISLLDIF